MTSAKQYYIETFGCQMNERDSEIMGQLLHDAAYSETTVMENADLIVVNTCSVREKAEQKAYSLLGRLKIGRKKIPVWSSPLPAALPNRTVSASSNAFPMRI